MTRRQGLAAAVGGAFGALLVLALQPAAARALDGLVGIFTSVAVSGNVTSTSTVSGATVKATTTDSTHGFQEGACVQYLDSASVWRTACGYIVGGTLSAYSTLDPETYIANLGASGSCSGHGTAVCVNDTGGLAIGDGAGNTAATIGATGKVDVNSAAANSISTDGGITAGGSIHAGGGASWCTDTGFNPGCTGDFYLQGGKIIQGGSGTGVRELAGSNSYQLASFETANGVQKAYVNNDGGYYDFTGRTALMSNNPANPTCEYGMDAGSSGIMTYDFLKAFSAVPFCMPADMTASNSHSCNNTATSTAQVTVTCSGAGSDVVGVMCCGPR